MKTVLFAVCGALTINMAAFADPMFSGTPDYENDDARELVERMLAAHGGLEPWQDVQALQFHFFTKTINAQGPNPQPPFYSIETTRLSDGAARLEWPFLGAVTGWDTETVWSADWPIPPLPPGFFTGLTTSFMTLPWLIQTDGMRVSAPYDAELPGENVVLPAVRVTFDGQGPEIPGEYYEVFIDPETHLLRAIGFNITHPQMVAIAGQSIGPNYHVFREYTRRGGLVIPSYYETIGSRLDSDQVVGAIHVAWNIRLDLQLNDAAVSPPPDAVMDEATMAWWHYE
jgi:hypothetical protein